MSQRYRENRWLSMVRSLRIYIGVLLTACLISCPTGLLAQVQVLVTVAPQPSHRISEWQSSREIVSLLVLNTTGQAIEAKIDASLKLNGSLVASTKFESMAVLTIPPGQATFFGADIFPQQAINFVGEVKQNVARSGMLPEGNYELCVGLLNAKNRAQIAQADCKTFFLTKYTMPVLLAPSNNAEVVAGLERSLLFSWTPLIPSPSPVTNYRVRLVTLFEKQEVKQAITNNQPLFEKTVTSIAQLLWPQEVQLPIEGGIYAWSIQPEGSDGTPLFSERFAEPFILTAFPSQDQCLTLLTQQKERQDTLINVEEKYWHSYEMFLRLSKLLEDAQLRADAYEIKKFQSEVSALEQQVIVMREQHQNVRSLYDAAVEQYKKCLGR